MIKLGESCPVKDWKAAVCKTLKEPGNWHFKLQPCKRIVITRTKSGNCVVRGEVNYNSDCGEAKSIVKRGKLLRAIQPAEVMEGIRLKQEKIQDLTTLLVKHYGQDWMTVDNLTFFTKLFEQQKAVISDMPEHDSDVGDLREDNEGFMMLL